MHLIAMIIARQDLLLPPRGLKVTVKQCQRFFRMGTTPISSIFFRSSSTLSVISSLDPLPRESRMEKKIQSNDKMKQLNVVHQIAKWPPYSKMNRLIKLPTGIPKMEAPDKNDILDVLELSEVMSAKKL